jgi:hypothetical protein
VRISRTDNQPRACTVRGCERPHFGKGLCQHHYNIRRRRRWRAALVELLGGKCVDCGGKFHPSTFDFHHSDPSKKSFGLGTGGKYRSFAALKAEAMKCELLCANCHRLRHYEGEVDA